MSWGGRKAELGWKIEWDGGGPLESGTTVYLYGKACPESNKYYESKATSRASWGAKSNKYAWTLQFDDIPLRSGQAVQLKPAVQKQAKVVSCRSQHDLKKSGTTVSQILCVDLTNHKLGDGTMKAVTTTQGSLNSCTTWTSNGGNWRQD